MADFNKKSTWIDPAKRAERVLDDLLEEASEDAVIAKAQESTVEEELERAPVAEVVSDRSQSRVLFITKDISVLQEGSTMQLHFLNVSELFNEVHIMVLCDAKQAKKGVERIGKNIWLYTTSVRYSSQQIGAAEKLAHDQLRFGDGFQPDIVVALDPAESGLAGMRIAEKFDRQFQVQVLEDFFSEEFLTKDKANKKRQKMAMRVLKRASSVRVATENLKIQISKRFPRLRDLTVLPRHYDIETLLKIADEGDATDIFPQFSFTILFVGKLDKDSTLFRAMDASRFTMQAKSIGLVIVGNGPNKGEFEKRAEILGIKEQVIFYTDQSRLLSCFKSADVLLCTDTSEESDEMVIRAAAAGVPLILAHTQLRDDLFTDGESAFLCNGEDTIEFSQKLAKFLNSNMLRTQFKENGTYIVKTRLHEDPEAYKLAYRDSIESVFSLVEETAQNKP